jgi:hypothetical protein
VWQASIGAGVVSLQVIAQSATPAQKKAALEYLRREISTQSSQKRPSLYLLNPGSILQAVRESERKKRRAAASTLF